jgi:hypothetical protein
MTPHYAAEAAAKLAHWAARRDPQLPLLEAGA